MPRRIIHIRVIPLLVLSFFICLMSLPDRASPFLDLMRPTASAASFTVNSTDDAADSNVGDGVCNDGTNACTLRAAIQETNNLAGDDTIGFSLPAGSTISLHTELPSLNGNLILTGPGAGQLTIRRSAAGGTPNFRIFTVGILREVTISGLTISGGNFGGGGAGIFVDAAATLTLSNSTVSDNHDNNFGGGGIRNEGTFILTNSAVIGNTGNGIRNFNKLVITGGTVSNNTGSGISHTGPFPLTVTNTTINGNAGGLGGGIFMSGGILTMTNSSVTGNTANGGAGIFTSGGTTGDTVFMTNSTVSGNSATAGSGAGIQSSGTLTLTNCTVSSNTTNNTGVGGGISMNFGSLSLINSLIRGNSSTFGGGLSLSNVIQSRVVNSTISGNNSTATGGGIRISGQVALTNLTITNNRSDSDNSGAETGGGIYQDGSFTLSNILVAGNFRGSSPGTTADDIVGTVNSASSFNLVGTGGSGGMTNGVNNNQVGVADAMIGPLADNGGPSLTHALLPGSPASDAGSNAFVTNPPFIGPPFTDQRGLGFNRIVDGPDAGTTATVDIGAYEKQPTFPDLPDVTGNEDTAIGLAFEVLDSASITSITATSSNTALVPNDPANITVTGSGSTRLLTVNPAANASGTSGITVTVNRTSGSESWTFTLTVNSVNDAPSFTKGPNQTVNENDGAQVVNNWATGISAGPPNESGQSLTFSVTDNTNSSLFAVAPAISSAGTLTYTPAPGVSGIATVTISLKDDGGTANGGVDTSPTQSFTIQILDGGALSFSGSIYNFNESSGSASIVINRSGGSAGTATVLFTTTNGTATSADYTSVSQTVTFLQGEVTKTVNVPITNDLNNEPLETVNLTLSSVGGSGQLGSLTSAQLRILNDDPTGGYIRFTSANFNTTESSGSIAITVERVGTTTSAVSANYATAQDSSTTIVLCSSATGVASSRCDFTSALGTFRFAAGEGSKTFTVLISQDNYVEGPESVTLSLSAATGGATFSTPSTATLTITDDATEPATNPIDVAEDFVRQHYHDFLNREPDAAGLAFWSNQITECQQPGATCDAEVRRINVSAAFFVSIEFQQTGYLVYRMYKTGYGNISGTPVPLTLSEFLPDTQQIGQGVVVGATNWETTLENNKVAYASNFVSRSRFTTAYPTTMSPAEFVDALFLNAAVTPSATDRNAAINEFSGAGNTAESAARGRALRRVAENSTLTQQEFNRAFVLMQYFGYLRRNPNDAPEPGLNFGGYNFWLGKLNEFDGNYIAAELVKAFINSTEYRQRFGQ